VPGAARQACGSSCTVVVDVRMQVWPVAKREPRDTDGEITPADRPW
jgi:hypothetical protein